MSSLPASHRFTQPLLSIFVTSLLFASVLSAPAANAWSTAQATVSVFGGSSIDEGTSIAIDSSGNVYTTGYFDGTVDFDPGTGTANLISAGESDVFVSKIDTSGNLVWAKRIGGIGEEFGNAIAVDSSGNVYTTGQFEGVVDFDPGVGTTSLTSTGSDDVFASKLDSSGNFVWAKNFGGSSIDEGTSIAIDSTGNIYTTGRFNSTADFDPGAGTENLASAGQSDMFISKLDSSGNFVWAKRFGGSSSDVGRSIAIDSSGSVYTVGYFRNTVDFDPGAGTENLVSAGSPDVFISKLDSSGNFVWAKRFGGTNGDYGVAIAIDSTGNVYTTGQFEGTVDFDPGAGTENLVSAGGSSDTDVFISKLDSSGAYVWAKNLGGTSNDYPESITVDSSGSVYTTGYMYNTADFDPGAGTANLVSVGQSDVFISKIDTSGNYVWAKSFGGTNHDSGRSIAVDANGNVYTTGHFNGTADFDPGAGTANLTSKGLEDVFIVKLNPLGSIPLSAAVGELDPTFGSGGKVMTDLGTAGNFKPSLAIQGDGKIVVTGSSNNGSNNDFALFRYNTNGTPDTSFDTDGKVTLDMEGGGDVFNAVAIQGDGKIVAAGFAYNGITEKDDFAVVRFNTNGSLDTTFNLVGFAITSIGATSDVATSVAIQSNGKIVVAGASTNGTHNDFAVVRYNTNGSLDTTFNLDGIVTTPIGTAGDIATSLAIESNGDIIVAGESSDIAADKDFALARYATNGTLVTSVSADIGNVDNVASSLALQSDGKIVISGYIAPGGNNDFVVARFNTDLTLDTNFGVGGVRINDIELGDDFAQSVAIQGDGKIVVAGYSITNISESSFVVVRYNPNGTADTSFDTDGISTINLFGTVESAFDVAIQSDGKIVISGVSFNISGVDLWLARFLVKISSTPDDSAEKARKAAAAAAAAEAARKQRELIELLAVIPSIAGLAVSIGDLTNSLFVPKKSTSAKQKCVKGTKTKYVKKGTKCPKGYVKKK